MTMVAGSTAESSTKVSGTPHARVRAPILSGSCSVICVIRIQEIGAPLLSTLDEGNTLGSASVPVMSAFFSPTLHVMERGGLDGPFAKIEGPCFFGGCSEYCCSFDFPVSKFGSAAKTGDIGKIVKQKPKSFGAALREVLTSADLYTLNFSDKSLTPEQKSLLIGGLLLNDYTYFESPQDACGVDPEDGKPYINLCNVYCCGCLCPCRCKLEGGGEGG